MKRLYKLGPFTCAATLALTTACVGQTDSPSTGDSDKDSTGGNITRHFLVNQVDVARVGRDLVGLGFDLDGLSTDGDQGTADDRPCLGTHTDPGSGFTVQQEAQDVTTPDGVVGVDNQFGLLAPALEAQMGFNVHASAIEAFQTGKGLVLVEVSGIDADAAGEDEVSVAVYVAKVPAGAELLLEDSGLVAPGQVFDVDPRSLTEEGEPLVVGSGVIADGKLSASASSLPMGVTLNTADLGIEGENRVIEIDLTLKDVTLTGDIDGETLTNGLLGGGIPVDPFLALLDDPNVPWESFDAITDRFGSIDNFKNVVRQLLSVGSDLGNGEDRNAACGRMSAGVVFGAVVAERAVEESDRADDSL